MMSERSNACDRWAGQETILSRVLMEMPEHVALLDRHGWIVWTNQAWTRFSEENDGIPGKTGVGVNYLSICERAERDHVLEAGVLRTKILAMLSKQSGQCESSVGQLEYPCDSPKEKRWFAAWVLRCEINDQVYVAIIHHNVTARRTLADRLIELQAEWAGFMRHEIKNPFSVILIHTGIMRNKLENRNLDFDGMIESCKKIERTLWQLSETVNGMPAIFKRTENPPKD